jgi:hypothetical protein
LFPRFGGVFLTNCTRGGLDRWIRSARCGLNRLQLEPVRDLVHRISDQGLRYIMRTIRSRPSVNNPTARTSPSRTGTLWFDQDRQRIIRRPTALLTIPHPNAAAVPPPPRGGPSPGSRLLKVLHPTSPRSMQIHGVVTNTKGHKGSHTRGKV